MNYTAKQAAHLMGVSQSTIYMRIQRGALDVIQINPILISEDEVNAYLDRHTKDHRYQTEDEKTGWTVIGEKQRVKHRERHYRAHFLRRLYPTRSRPRHNGPVNN